MQNFDKAESIKSHLKNQIMNFASYSFKLIHFTNYSFKLIHFTLLFILERIINQKLPQSWKIILSLSAVIYVYIFWKIPSNFSNISKEIFRKTKATANIVYTQIIIRTKLKFPFHHYETGLLTLFTLVIYLYSKSLLH